MRNMNLKKFNKKTNYIKLKENQTKINKKQMKIYLRRRKNNVKTM